MVADKISGYVDRIIFYNDEGWGVFSVITPEGEQTITGYALIARGDSIEFSGKKVVSPKWGEQIKADFIQKKMPETKEGIKNYLASGQIKGIGPKLSQAIVDHFGNDTLKVLDEDISRLLEVPGIGKTKYEVVKKSWEEVRTSALIMSELHKMGIPNYLCFKLYEQYKNKVVDIVSKNPYALVDEVKGIGFTIADKIAQNIGIPFDSPYRIRAGIIFSLGESVKNGNTCVKESALIKEAEKVLKISTQKIIDELDFLVQAGRIIFEPDLGNVYFPTFLYYGERRISDWVLKERKTKKSLNVSIERIEVLIKRKEEERGITLTAQQKQAIINAIEHPISILTGGPGVGKTATLSVLVDVVKAMGRNIVLAAPTGKAARRASEVTGLDAGTLHRVFDLFNKDKPKPVSANLFVIDESSMIDVPMLSQITKSLTRGQHVLFVGDVDQLPSVGPGQVLKDLIYSEKVPVTRLTQVFRQASNSKIITNAYKINNCQMPEDGGFNSDFVILTEKNTKSLNKIMTEQKESSKRNKLFSLEVRDIIGRLMSEWSYKWGYNPVKDAIVLSPMNGGDVGVNALNKMLKKLLNPKPIDSITLSGETYSIGDKVMQTVNDYEANVFNGEVGVITNVNKVTKTVTVRFDSLEDEVEYSGYKIFNLRLAYSMTIHKSQGSQAPLVIIPVISQHHIMLTKNILYTGVTRAEKKVVLIGMERFIAKAVKNVESSRRLTGLQYFLEHE